MNKLKRFLSKKRIPIAIALVVALLLMLAPINVAINPPPGNIDERVLTLGQGQIVLTIGTNVYAAGVADYTCDGVADDVQFQAALNALPAGGGKLVALTGGYSFSATVLRAIDNVTIEGMGDSTYFTNDGGTALFDAGSQDGWVFRNFRTDAGGVDVDSTTDYVITNVTVGTTVVGKITREATFVVAASDSSDSSKAQADYVCDGTDDDVQIQASLNTLPVTGGEVRLLEGIFTINAQIDIPSNTTLSGSGLGTILRVVPATFPDNVSVVRFNSTSKSIIRDLLIDGEWDNGRINNDHGIELSGCADCLIENVYVEQCRGQGIAVGSSATRCIISKSIFYHNEHRGINIGGESTFLMVSDCTAIDNYRSGFLVGSPGISSSYIEFVNCITYNPSDDNISSCFNIQTGSHHCKLTNCTVYTSNSFGFDASGDYSQLVNCSAYDTTDHAFKVEGDYCQLSNCVSNTSAARGFTVGTDHCVFTNCSSHDAIQYGFRATGQYNQFIGCVVERVGTGFHGFSLEGTNNLVDSCMAFDNDQNGISITGNECKATSNHCERNGLYGIRVYDSSKNLIQGNTCKNNGQAGINTRDGIEVYGASSEYNIIEGNHCYDDQDGVSSFLTADAGLGETSVTVANGTLFFEGQWVTISDDTPDTENNQISNITGNVLTVTALANDYTQGQNAVVTGRKTQRYGISEINSANQSIIRNNTSRDNITNSIIGVGANSVFDQSPRSIAINLIGGATDIEIFHALAPSVLVGYTIFYNVATGAGAGVNIRVGMYRDGVALDDDYFDVSVSELNKGIGYSKHFVTTDLTQSVIAAGDTVTVGTAGAKGDTGKVIIILQIAEMAD